MATSAIIALINLKLLKLRYLNPSYSVLLATSTKWQQLLSKIARGRYILFRLNLLKPTSIQPHLIDFWCPFTLEKSNCSFLLAVA